MPKYKITIEISSGPRTEFKATFSRFGKNKLIPFKGSTKNVELDNIGRFACDAIEERIKEKIYLNK